jgi:SPP1 family predicted phage head-tail adaptor
MIGRMLPITLLYPTVTSDGAGGETHAFTSYGADWAEIKTERVSQEDNSKQVVNGAALRFKIRYRASLSITDKWRIRFEGTDYRILSIEREGLKKEYYLIKAKALS